MLHTFSGKWITTEALATRPPLNMFHRQLDKKVFPPDPDADSHILYRRRFSLAKPKKAEIYITADDYYKLYINGCFVAQGPAPAYHFRYGYNVINVTPYLTEGDNVIAVHTLYQGLINRVWQSGDGRHGLILDLVADGTTVLSSDECFRIARHTGYTATGTVGYATQFLETYDSAAPEADFADKDFDDSAWGYATVKEEDDHTLLPQASKMLSFEEIHPTEVTHTAERVFIDFGATYVGYLHLTACGKAGDTVVIRQGQELTEDGRVRYSLRANCDYEETWVLADGESRLDEFDYKAFRYAELILPEGVALTEISLTARHYPFETKRTLRKDFAEEEMLKRIFALCLHTQKYGVQEVIQDCMEREKGFYLGDGCYTALTHMLLSEDDSMVRKLIDDAFSTDFITDTLVTCLDCSFMQEIAEYPLMLVFLVLWHYNYTKDKNYLAENYVKVKKLLDAYAREYEHDGLLSHLNKWCVVEWPKNFQHGYDVDITEGKVCEDAHVAINAYYLAAIKTANRIASALGEPPYRDVSPLLEKFRATFYKEAEGLFRDGENTEHVSLVGNVFVYAFGLSDDPRFLDAFYRLYAQNGISSLSMFCTFPALWGFVTHDREDLVREALLDEGAWRRILREGGTTTFEGWGKDTKWNTSLFHMTMSYAAAFMTDIDLKEIF